MDTVGMGPTNIRQPRVDDVWYVPICPGLAVIGTVLEVSEITVAMRVHVVIARGGRAESLLVGSRVIMTLIADEWVILAGG